MRRALLFHSWSSLHAGIGAVPQAVDLPIARRAATGIPFLSGSSIKGQLRNLAKERGLRQGEIQRWFGPDKGHASEHAGLLRVFDAQLLALPVPSLRQTFAWVTAPLALAVASRTLTLAGQQPPAPIPVPPHAPGARVAAVENGPHPLLFRDGPRNLVLLKDLDLPGAMDQNVAAWAQWLAQKMSQDDTQRQVVGKRFTVVDDETFSHLCELATEVVQRNRIDSRTRTVAEHALWSEECLPPETVLLGMLEVGSRPSLSQSDGQRDLIAEMLQDARVVAFGSDQTIGRGLCRVIAV